MNLPKNQFDQINQKAFAEDIRQIDSAVMVPPNKAGINTLARYLRNVSAENPLHVYIGSCPDYAHVNGKYTHTGIGGGVPLLTLTHLAALPSCIEIFDRYSIPYVVDIMIADIEAEDEFFARKFTNGDRQSFRNLCMSSMHQSDEALKDFRSNHTGTIRSTSFFERFGKENFLNTYAHYYDVLKFHYEHGKNGSFRMRVEDDVTKRMSMYQNMYRGFYEEMGTNERGIFFVSRTIRTMAQYLTLARLIAQNSEHPIIINHATTNVLTYNDRNTYLLPGDEPNKPPIPIFTLTKKIYD